MANGLSIVNPDPKRIPGPTLLHHLIPADDDDLPAAIEYLSQTGDVEYVSYKQLHHRVNAVAQYLRSIWEGTATSVKGPFVVPIFVPQCPSLYISELAALKAGAAFCPISLDVPEERLRFILQDIGARFILTTSQLRQNLPIIDDVTIIAIDEISFKGNVTDLSIEIDSSQPAYIMYTSGSTGKPKGVVLSHSAATQALLAHDPHIPKFCRFLQFANPTFDVSVFEIFFPLFRRSTLICGDRRLLLDDLVGFVNSMEIDAAELTPSVASSLLRGRESVPNLKLLLTIGEMLKRDIVEDFGSSNHNDGILFGMYGPTEATIHCTLQTAFATDMPIGNIGVPLDTVSAFVIKPPESGDLLDGPVEILSIGKEGELAIGGHQLADGYLNRPEQTNSAFIYHSKYGRLYRTGDRVRLTRSGTLECSGRISGGQVKLRGQRVELGEIEHAASKSPGCRTVVADIISGALVVFCLCDEASTDEKAVQESCRKWLPAFMVPTEVILLNTLPYLPSGKVDRKALHQLYTSSQHSHQTNGTTSARLEVILDVLSDVLQVPIDPHTRLAAYGMDSLSSIRVASLLKQSGLPRPSATLLLKARTALDIEREISNVEQAPIEDDCNSKYELASILQQDVYNKSLTPDHQNEVEDVLEITAVQSAMLSETAKNCQAYCNWIQFLVLGSHLDDVHTCLKRIASRHPLIRSGFLAAAGSQPSHVLILWKSLLSTQIQHVDELDYNFLVANEADLLRPLSLQLKSSDRGVQVLLQIHHALYDQWSIDVFKKDLSALLRGREIDRRPSFKSVCHYQSALQRDDSSEQGLEFWTDHLRGYAPTPLPLMRGTKIIPKLERTSWFSLLPDISSARDKARSLEVSLPVVFQAVTSYLLGCYTGSTDVVYGVVFSGRHLPITDLEMTFGPCLNTLPMRVDYSATRSCLDLLKLIQDRNRAMQSQSHIPLGDIKSVSDATMQAQLFDVLFVWQETSLDSQKAEDIVQEVDSADHHEFNLVLEFEPSKDGIRARATYQQALVTPQQIDILLDQVRALVDRILEAPHTPVEDLPRHLPDHLLSSSNTLPLPCGANDSLLTSFEKHAMDHPHRPALIFANDIENVGPNTDTLTYSDLNREANRMANFLRSLGVLPDDLVCICMNKCVEFYVSVIATVKIGAGYLPITSETPETRIRSILSQARTKLCLCDNDTEPVLGGLQISEVANVHGVNLTRFDDNNIVVSPSKSQLAYTIFTSGSTGEPKGVPVTAQNLLGNLKVLAELYQVRQGDRLLQACSHAFDVSVFEIFFALHTGMCLCAAPKDKLFKDLEGSINGFNITHLSLTPTVAALVDPNEVPSVRFLVTAGEGVTDLVHRRWANKGLNQGYGPSETTNICTINMGMSRNDVLGNIGPPLRNTSAFVASIDKPFNLLPAGSIGEFIFGGEQVFPGYIGMEQLNAEKLVHEPTFGRLYKSGDLGRILHDGSLLIDGRADDQVKFRGNRIELGDINAALMKAASVHDCTSTIISNSKSDESLVAFIVPDYSSADTSDDVTLCELEDDAVEGIYELLEDSLPTYMIPSSIVALNRLPHTSQGKLDRRCLRQLYQKTDSERTPSLIRLNESHDSCTDWGSEECQIASALAETLGIPSGNIARSQSFFAIGLTSLNAFAFSKLLQTKLQANISVSTILRNPSVRRLAQCITSHQPNGVHDNSRTPQLLPSNVIKAARDEYTSLKEDIDEILPCTPLQEAMLSSSSTKVESSYCNTLILQVSGDTQKLKRSWRAMVERHAMLRTSFLSTNFPSHPYVQVVLKQAPLPWHDETDPASNGICYTRDGQSRFQSVSQSNPFRIYATTSDGETKLVINMHHAIYDGISMSRLLQEVELEYHGMSLPAVPPLTSFLAEMQKQSGDDAMSFWSAKLEGFRPKPFPMPNQSLKSKESVIQSQLTVSLERLEAYCKHHAISQLGVFQTALAKTLSHCQGTEDICFGNVMSGRTVTVEGVEDLVAPCFNTVPVRIDLANICSNIELSRYLSQRNSDILDYQLTPLRRIQSLSLSKSRHLFDTLLILQPPTPHLDNSIWTLEAESGSMDMPLVFEIDQRNDRYRLLMHFLEPDISPHLAKAIREAFTLALDIVLKYPHSDAKSHQDFESMEIAGALCNNNLGKYETKYDSHTGTIWTVEEDVVREVFSRLTGVQKSRIYKTTSMYQLGLDSLNAAQVARQLRSSGMKVDATDVIETTTPLALGALAKERAPSQFDIDADEGIDLAEFEKLHRESISNGLQLEDNNIEAIRPCTSVQSGMLAQSINSAGRLYINHVAYQIPDSVSMLDLRTAWQIVCGRHQVLRMGFCELQNAVRPFAMIIWKSPNFVLPLLEAEYDVHMNTVNERAENSIMKCLDQRAWQITICGDRLEKTMVLSLHHALYDADGLRIILEDLAKALSSFELSPPLSIDKILRSTIAGETDDNGSMEQFWRGSLIGASASKFPDLSPSVSRGELRSEFHVCELSIATTERFCQQHQATLQALGQTAWAWLLAEYTGDTNVIFGTIFSGKPTSGAWDVVFPSVTTIPVPANAHLSVPNMLQSMVNYNASAQRHRFVPLADIQRYAGYAGRPLFDTVFVYQKTSPGDGHFKWPLLKETPAVDYVASLELEHGLDDTMQLRLTTDTARIPTEQARIMLQQFDHIISEIVSYQGLARSSSMSTHSISPAREPSLPTDVQLLHQVFEKTACQHPHRNALEFIHTTSTEVAGRKTWTYKELEQRGNQVAHLIKNFGVAEESTIAVCMNKCPEASFAFLGILKAGSSFLAIDPELPRDRLQFILEDSRACLLLVDAENRAKAVPGNTACVILAETMLVELPGQPLPTKTISPQTTSYCLYTSGTTGTPKGCEISHKNAVQAMLAFQRLFAGHWTDASRWLQFASYWFDVSVLEHFWSWSVGITVVGAPRDLVLEDLPGFIQRQKITHIDLTPSLARLVHPEDVPSLWGGVFITGGEALKQEIIDAWGPKTTVCNGYGPTEATIGVTMNTFIGTDAKPSNIGRPFDNVGAYVLKANSEELVLRGAVGELCVSGELVGKGYLNRPDLTSKSFPHLHRFDERVYRTGDLVRLLADGSFAFIGRQDSQTKLRGQRLEIEEIDNTISQAAEPINEVISLVVRAGSDGKEMLVSFFTITSQSRRCDVQIDYSKQAHHLVKIVKEACTSRLPGYMVPTHILPIGILPLTVNNKIDSKRLIALFTSTGIIELQSFHDIGNDTRPLTRSEQTICQALSEIIHFDRNEVSTSTNLFSLGLSSISAISFSSMLKRAGLSKASVAIIMQNPTLGDLSHALLSAKDTQQEHDSVEQSRLWIRAFEERYLPSASETLSLRADRIETLAPCTPLQQGLIVDSLRTEGQPYFNDFHYRLKSVDIAKLKVALQELVNQVQALRTRFISTDEGYAQVMLRKMRVPLQVWNLQPDKVDSFLIEKKSRWMDNNVDTIALPFETHIIRSSTTDYLAIFIHHALYDGISYELLINKLSDLYQSASSMSAGPAFTTALPYGPLRSLHGAESFWRRQIESKMHSSLPIRGAAAGCSDPVANMTIKDASQIEEFRRALGVSHQAVFQACFEIAYNQHAPSSQVYGTVISGRSIEMEGADRVLGPMFNTLPYPLDLAPDATFDDLVVRCHNLNIEMLPFQHTPLRDIRKWYGLRPSDQLFEALFVFQHGDTSTSEYSAKIFQPIEKAPRAEYPLACEVDLVSDGDITITMLAQSAFFDQSTLESVLQNFRKALDCLITHDNDTIQTYFQLQISAVGLPREIKTKSSPMTNGVTPFEWSDQAKRIRQEIAQLTETETGDIDEHTSIFTLGIDSIDAVKLVSRLKKHGIAMPVSKLLRAQTIPKIIDAISSHQQVSESTTQQSNMKTLEQQIGESAAMATFHQMQDIERVLPATPQQEALVVDMLRSDLQEYFNHDILRLHKGTDVQRLKDVWTQLVQSTPILRTYFTDIADPNVSAVFAQVVHRSGPAEFGDHELRSFDGIANILDDIKQNVLNNFDALPPWRLTFVSIKSEVYLVLSLAHALYDGHSLALLHEDVQRAYNGTFTPRPHNDYAIESALAATGQSARDFWSGTLSGAKVTRLPLLTFDAKPAETYRAERSCETDINRVYSFCRNHGVTVQALTQTCWALTLAHCTHNLEVIFGVVFACRDTEEAEGMMFPMMNTLPMRSSLHGSRKQMLQYMQGKVTDILPYQRTPLRMVQAACADTVIRDDSDSGNGLFDTLFIYQQIPHSSEPSNEPLYESVEGKSNVEYPVAVEIEVREERLIIRAACKSNFLDQKDTNGLIEKIEYILNAIVDSPDQPTVAFEGDTASVCGLQPFSTKSNEQDIEKPEPRSDEVELSAEPSDSVVLNKIIQTLAEVSNVPASDITPNVAIESLGIDSISSIKVAALLRKQSLDLSVSQIIKGKTPAGIASAAEKKTDVPNDLEQSPSDVIAAAVQNVDLRLLAARTGIDSANIEAILPATAGQLYMLKVWQNSRGQLFYPTFEYQLETHLGLDQIKQAWEVLVDRHSILRTVFCASKDADVPLLQVVLQDAPESFSSDGKTAVGAPRKQPMVYLQADKNGNVYHIKLNIHHALYDAVSLPLLMEDFRALLARSETPRPKIKQEDFLALSVTPKARQRQRRFWTRYLTDAKLLSLQQLENDGLQRRTEIFNPAVFTSISNLELVGRNESLSIQALLFAAYAKVYSQLAAASRQQQSKSSGPVDTVLGIYLSNRSHLTDLDKLSAPTLNLVPLLVRTPQEKSLLDLARQIQKDLREIGTAENSAISLKDVHEWTGVRVDTFVNFLKLPDRDEHEAREGSVVLKELDERRQVERNEVIEAPEDDSFEIPEELKELSGGDAYLHSVDIEMTVTDGKLGVGLFGPEVIVGLTEANDGLLELKGLLEKLVGKAKA